MNRLLCVLLLIVLSLVNFGCNTTEEVTDLHENISSTESNPSEQYTIGSIIKPEIIDESSNYKNFELVELNKKIEYKPVSEIYFLDDDNIIFSIRNDVDSRDINEKNDLYKYNLNDNTLSVVCHGFRLYPDSFVNVKDLNNFSIVRNAIYLTVENNEIRNKENMTNVIRNEYPNASDIFFNSENNKMIILDNTEEITKVIVSDNGLHNIQEIEIKNIYRIQWADNENILIAYKDDSGISILVKYNLVDNSIINTTMLEDNCFIDPIKCDADTIKFFYINDPRTEKPWGFLDLDEGIIERIHFDSCNPISILRNSRMAGFINTEENYVSQLFLYDNKTKISTIRNISVKLPQKVAVSPDGSKVIYVAGNFNGESRFYINK